MTANTGLTRRAALAAAAAAAGTALARPGVSHAAAPKQGGMKAEAYRFTLGEYELTTFSDGMRPGDGPHPIFGQNVDAAEVAQLLEANFLPADKFINGFTPTLLNTGEQLVLFDTGLGAGARPGMGRLRSHLEAAGVSPEQVDLVVITHFHPDHIGGLMEEGGPAFPNASYVTAAAEYDFWTPEERMSGPTERVAKITASNVKPLADKFRFVKAGDTVAPGVEAVEAAGHTPGHLAYHVESAGRRLMITADTCNHYVVSLQRPDWHVRFDMDKEGAAAARKQVFGMIAADRIPFIGYHMPFPAVGYVEAMGEGFRYVPASYQLDL